MNTRPDITYAVGVASRFMEAPDKEHWAMVKRIVRYVVGTIQLGLKYKKGRRSSELSLLGYTASDHSGDLALREIGSLQSATGTRQSQKNTRQSVCRVPEKHSAKSLPSATLDIAHLASILTANSSLSSVFCRALGKDVAECGIDSQQKKLW